MRRNPLIIGGGPAGAAAAITLARAGRQPVVIDRSMTPIDKVCGDFLSTDTIERAQALGVDPAGLGAASIGRVRVIHGDQVAETTLPFPAMGLSRRVLDAALLNQAIRAGALVRTGQAVRGLGRRNGIWAAHCADQETIQADTVFLATGKHDVRDLPRPGTEHGAVGMKMYFTLRPQATAALEGVTELTLFPGGYAGMQPVDDGRTVLCIAVRRPAFQALGASWPALLDAIACGSARFGAMLAGATALLPRPLAVAGIPYGFQASPNSEEGLFRIGDQAVVIPSLTGDGLAMALHSGQSAAGAWLTGAGPGQYHRALARRVAPQMRLAGLLHGIGMHAPAQAAALFTLRLFPSLLRRAARYTRLSDDTAT